MVGGLRLFHAHGRHGRPGDALRVSRDAVASALAGCGTPWRLVATPWRATYHAVYAAYLGMVAESLIIDSDHWRHYFLILGVLWGLMSVTRSRLAIGRENVSPRAMVVKPA